MSVAKMKLANITAPKEALDAVTRVCGKCGVFQPEDPLSFYSDASDFILLNEESPYTAPLNALTAAFKRLGGEPDEAAEPCTWETGTLLRYAEDFVNREAALDRETRALAEQIEKCRKDAEQFTHFQGLGIGLDEITRCENIRVRFGRLPIENYEKLEIYKDNPYVLFFPGSMDKDYYWGVYCAPAAFSEDVDRIFSALYFERMQVPEAVGTPEEVLTELKRQEETAAAALEEKKSEAAEYFRLEEAACQRALARLSEEEYLNGVRRWAVQYRSRNILMIGWIPAADEAAFAKEIGQIEGAECTFEDPANVPHHQTPVKLKNRWPFKVYEYFVEMYGVPRYGEIDPTAFLAITYTLLFGIMFGDLGQGLVVSLVGLYMWKKRDMPIGRILIHCGISSAVCGVIFGSVFGFEHALDGFYRMLGFAEKPIEVMDSAISIILFAVGVGLTLIVISMLLNIYSSLKQRDFENGLFGPSGVAGLLFFGSLVAGLGGQLAFGWKLMTLPYILGLILLPLLLIFLREPLGKLVAGEKDWMPEKWGEFILQNFFEVFEILLTYLSNTMSFMRVGAFVLIHAGMMLAVFTLAGLFGTMGFIITVVVGNIIVMAMEALLVAIQVMRLEFYEMFSRYYSGEGRPFTPLKQQVKN